MREIYFIVIFFIAKGFLSPSFEDFSYYFLLDVIQISKLMFAILVLIGQICMIIGALIYKAFCRSIATRTMVMIAMIIFSTGAFLNYCFAKRWNLELGISDIFFLFFTDIIFNTLATVFYSLPIYSFFAKICPGKIEATIYAFLTGTGDFSGMVISPLWGTFINYEFVGCNKNDMSGYSTLCLISFILSLFMFFLLPLIPTKQQLKEWKKVRK